MTKREKAKLSYVDFYWAMTNAEFVAWQGVDGDSFELSTDER